MIGIDAVRRIDPKIADRVAGAFRALGGSWSRWSRLDHETFASALTRVEDGLEQEAQGPRKERLRVALRAVRRHVEDELARTEPQRPGSAETLGEVDRPFASEPEVIVTRRPRRASRSSGTPR